MKLGTLADETSAGANPQPFGRLALRKTRYAWSVAVLCLLQALGVPDTRAQDSNGWVPVAALLDSDGVQTSLSWFTPTPKGRLTTVLVTTDLSLPISDWTGIYNAPAGYGGGPIVLEADAPYRFFQVITATNRVPSRMAWIPPGRFSMGSAEDDPQRYADEGPQREVVITNGFWLGRYEVMQSEFLELIPYNPSTYKADLRCPVETVAWSQAMRYCELLTAREKRLGRLPPGYVYRLPTEAEWEYACRAGTTTAFYFGDNSSDLDRHAWWIYNSSGHPHPVGEKLPNPWGLYDIHGNVFEWCLNWYEPYPGGVILAETNYHTDRGGSFYCPARVIRSATRSHAQPPPYQSNLIGFRVLLGPPCPVSSAPPGN